MLDKIRTKNIDFFEDLTQYGNYDFHNDYVCKEINYLDSELILSMKDANDTIVCINFEEVLVVKAYINVSEDLVIDNLYRGRFETNGYLIDIFNDEYSYFYLEFYNGTKLEFWAKYLKIY